MTLRLRQFLLPHLLPKGQKKKDSSFFFCVKSGKIEQQPTIWEKHSLSVFLLSAHVSSCFSSFFLCCGATQNKTLHKKQTTQQTPSPDLFTAL